MPDAQADVPEWVAGPTLSDTALAGNKMAFRVNKNPPAKPGVFHRRAKPFVTSGTRTARWYGLPAAILLLAARKRAFLA